MVGCREQFRVAPLALCIPILKTIFAILGQNQLPLNLFYLIDYKKVRKQFAEMWCAPDCRSSTCSPSTNFLPVVPLSTNTRFPAPSNPPVQVKKKAMSRGRCLYLYLFFNLLTFSGVYELKLKLREQVLPLKSNNLLERPLFKKAH